MSFGAVNSVSSLFGMSIPSSGGSANPGTSVPMYARYTATNYNTATNTWKDSGPNKLDIPSSRITSTGLSLVSTTGNAASQTFYALQGTNSSRIDITTAQIPQYTLFHVARLTGGANGRIFSSSTNNWLSGSWNGNIGIAHHDSWVTPSSTPSALSSNLYQWLISTDSYNLYRYNGVSYQNATGSNTFLPNLSIGAGENSNFQVADIIIYNSYLSATDYKIVEAFLSKLYGIPVTA
jgi:hypothetical protein